MLVILAHGKMRLLGNNRNNVTRQDGQAHASEWWAQPFTWGSEGEKKESRLFAGGRGRLAEIAGSGVQSHGISRDHPVLEHPVFRPYFHVHCADLCCTGL